MPRKLYLYTFVAALGGFLFGFDTAVINGALPFFREHFNLTGNLEGLAVSSAIFGCVAGALFIGRPGDRYGRRYMLRIMAVLFIISALGSGLATSIYEFMIFRVVGGLAPGHRCLNNKENGYARSYSVSCPGVQQDTCQYDRDKKRKSTAPQSDVV